MLDAATCHAACDARDRRFDGRFYVGIRTTGVYCRCICPARTPRRENRRFWPSAAAAEAAGFRPCLLCRPERAPGLAPIDAAARLAAAASARIEAGALEDQGLEQLAAELGVTSRHLRRVMQASYGASPLAIAQTGRLLAARRLLHETALPLTQIAFASGFRSLRRFQAALKERYGAAPSRMRGRGVRVRGDSFGVRLAARGDLACAPLLEFLAARALSGVERVDGRRYARTLRVGDTHGWLEVLPDEHGLQLRLAESLLPHLRPVVAAVRGAFDLDAEMGAVDGHLARDRRLAAEVRREPGVRVPGALDGFETALRAVLGQQITVAGARTLGSRLVARFGQPIEGGPEGLEHLFPAAEDLAQARPGALAALGLPRRRAETLRLLAVEHAEGRLPLSRGAIAAGRAALARLPGVGAWTVEYVALRALGDPDAWPATDRALVLALGRPDETLEDLRPWRAYAAIRLWRRAGRLRAGGRRR